MKSETALTRELCKSLRERNAMVFPIVAGKYQPPGWPDRLIAHAHCGLVLVEFKSGGGELRPDQRPVVAGLRERTARSASGCACFVARWVTESCLAVEDEEGRELARCQADTPHELAGEFLRTLGRLRK